MESYSCKRNYKLAEEAKAFIKIIESLNFSCIRAGGMGFTIDTLERISAADLLATLCTNNIKFVYEKE